MSYIQTKFPSGPYDPIEIQRVKTINGVSGDVTLSSSETVLVRSNGNSFSLDVIGGPGGGGGSGPVISDAIPDYANSQSLAFTFNTDFSPPGDGWIQALKSGAQANTSYIITVNGNGVWAYYGPAADCYSPLIAVKATDVIKNTATTFTFIHYYPPR
jgi:hypothetical protein